jgi:hypothetical protein
MQGAEQLSQAVLESGPYIPGLAFVLMADSFTAVDPEVVRRNHDLSAQLTGRKERLSWLIRFINDNAVLVKV